MGMPPQRPGEPRQREPLLGRYRLIRSHSAQRRRVPITLIVAVLVGLAAIGAGLRYVPGSPLARPDPARDADTARSAELEPLPFRSAPVTASSVKTSGFYSWALLDRRTGQISGPANASAASPAGRMVAAWLAADYLRRAEAAGRRPSDAQLADLAAMLRDSDDSAAERTFQADGGNPSITRLIGTCKLTETRPVASGWRDTLISARDIVRMGQCLAGGAAAGPQWTVWLLNIMREVRGAGDFGIRSALPTPNQAAIAIANGWSRTSDGTWRVSCLAIADTWAMAVLERYPGTGDDNADLAHTKQVCRDTAALLRDKDVPLR